MESKLSGYIMEDYFTHLLSRVELSKHHYILFVG
jgi:hypothetical protein